ncbi:heavy metal-associated domain-containing protein [uncultured Croceitalea sp.]|uniref:heavy-metal-associated domain-containing protein n=1 Tax=uncultured Croceitalea sp. TaxID=1798908 RepID=UPI003305AF0E
MESIIIVQNLKCDGCANSIKKALEKLRGVSKVDVEVTLSEIRVSHEPSINLNIVEEKLTYLGYPKENAANSFSTKAKSFVSCGIGRISNS